MVDKPPIIESLENALPAINKSKTRRASILKKPKLLAAVFLIIVSAGAGFLGGWLGTRNGSFNSLGASNRPAQQIVSSESQLIRNISQEVGPSVVSVNVTGTTQSTDTFGFSSPVQQESAGTGIILSSAGVIITNRHVVPTGTTSVSVTLADGTTLNNVSVIGRTPDTDPLDIAFLKINDEKGETLTPAVIGDSSKVQVGDQVVAIGNALGQFQNTVTSGIISGYGRSLQASDQGTGSNSETLQDLFQTDAAINEGNSGGPLVNSSGEVIGINTAIAGNAQDIGFAIPINDTEGLIKSVLNQGQLLTPYLGVRYLSLTDDIASQYKLSVNRGAYIAPGGSQASIIPGSPAAKAGLKEGDIITKVDSTAIDQNDSLTSVLGRYSVGATVTLTVIRNGKTIVIKATLAAAPQS
jgi:serine protease Do